MTKEHTLIKGTIIKGIGGFYYVESSGRIYECKAKGLFRKQGLVPAVGDHVMVKEGTGGNENVIREILPRKNDFIRPPAANVETCIITAASAEPDPIFSFIDRLIIMAEKKETDVILVFNKADLIGPEERDRIRGIYINTGYDIVFTSTMTGEGIDELRELIKGRQCMMAGASGVGKSSLVNAVGGFEMEIGEISRKTQRGKHTTRHVELLLGRDGVRIFDTPGFTSYEIFDIEAEELKEYFPEFEEHSYDCRFNDCMHIGEPDCGVKAAAEEGLISRERYESYTRIFNELKERKR